MEYIQEKLHIVVLDGFSVIILLSEMALPRVNNVTTEVEVLRWAMLTMFRFHYNKIIFESNSQQLISLIIKEQSSIYIPSVKLIIQNIKFLNKHFEEFKFVLSYREGNGVEDKIAK